MFERIRVVDVNDAAQLLLSFEEDGSLTGRRGATTRRVVVLPEGSIVVDMKEDSEAAERTD